MRGLSEEVRERCSATPQSFRLGSARKAMHATCEQHRFAKRATLVPPAETLQRGEGSCRDLALVFLAASRIQGFAGRFVSGYTRR